MQISDRNLFHNLDTQVTKFNSLVSALVCFSSSAVCLKQLGAPGGPSRDPFRFRCYHSAATGHTLRDLVTCPEGAWGCGGAWAVPVGLGCQMCRIGPCREGTSAPQVPHVSPSLSKLCPGQQSRKSSRLWGQLLTCSFGLSQDHPKPLSQQRAPSDLFPVLPVPLSSRSPYSLSSQSPCPLSSQSPCSPGPPIPCPPGPPAPCPPSPPVLPVPLSPVLSTPLSAQPPCPLSSRPPCPLSSQPPVFLVPLSSWSPCSLTFQPSCPGHVHVPLLRPPPPPGDGLLPSEVPF